MLPRIGLCALLVLGLSSPLSAQWKPDKETNTLFPHQFTVMGGVGNAMGTSGIQGERYFKSGRLSVFGGMGFTPQLTDYSPSGVTMAAGLRGFTPGTNHRLFLELSVSQISSQVLFPKSGLWVSTDGDSKLYGPGLQAGYQFIADGGFTFMASFGAGYAIGQEQGWDKVGNMFGLGFGYTWR